MKLKLSEIIIGQRQRLDLGDLSDLVSMEDRDVGLIQPIVVHKTLSGWELVDGRRRLEKATQLGWPEVEVYEKDQLTEVQKQKQELFADIGRKDRTWQEKCLAISQVHFMLEREKRGQGESWTTTQMASFTGIGKSSIRAMLTVAEALEVKPQDSELWTCENYVTAYKLVAVDRPEAEARKELERRRGLLNQESLPQSEFTMNDDAPSSPGQSLASTEEAPHVYLHGFNKSLSSCDLEKEVGLNLYSCILANEISDADSKVVGSLLRESGYLIIWQREKHALLDLFPMPWFLVWNLISTEKENGGWPFVPNYAYGVVYCPTLPTAEHPNASTSTISAMADGDMLPSAVIDYSLKACCPPNLAVLCLGAIDLRAVIDCGHIPIWFEPDPEKYSAQCQLLKDHYEANIPGIEVRTHS